MKKQKWLPSFTIKKKHIRLCEECLFFFLLALNLIPVFSGTFFPTYDGPAHLYNAQLIISLLFGNNPTLEKFFCFNPEPVPNWIGHFFLVILNSFLPASIAEKILVSFYLIALPLSFRNLVKTLNPENLLLAT